MDNKIIKRNIYDQKKKKSTKASNESFLIFFLAFQI